MDLPLEKVAETSLASWGGHESIGTVMGRVRCTFRRARPAVRAMRWADVRCRNEPSISVDVSGLIS